MLDVVFGERPVGYPEDLGRRLDARVGVYWTGEKICAREFSPGHLDLVAKPTRVWLRRASSTADARSVTW